MEEELTPNPIFEVPKNINIIKHEFDPIYASNITYPKFSLGFQHFIHQSLKKMENTIQFENKKKVYDVYNNYSIIIDEYDESISNIGSKLFKNTNLDQYFYVYWELLCLFNLGHTKHENLHNNKSMELACDYFKRKDNKTLYTSIVGQELDYKETQEQQILNNILHDIKTVLNDGKKNDNFILKINESYTIVTCKLICMLSDYFESVYIVKPLALSDATSEKYIICINLKTNSKLSFKDDNMLDIYTNYQLTPSLISFFIKVNTTFGNKQFKKINEINGFIDRQNYRGEEYQQRKKIQINSTKIWVESFLTEKNKNLKEYVNACILIGKNNLVTVSSH